MDSCARAWSSRSNKTIVTTACTAGVAIIWSSLLNGCAATSSDNGSSVATSVYSASAGFTWTTDRAAGLAIDVHEFDGIRRTLSWPPSAAISDSSLQQLRTCLTNLRATLRYADGEMRATPQLIGSSVDRCIESASMPHYVETQLTDAIAYVVEIEAGNANDHMPVSQGSRIGASGSAFLGVQRIVSRADTNHVVITIDTKHCIDVAANKGVFESSSVTMGSQDTLQTQSRRVTIEPMIDRFDRCIRERGYSVGESSR